MPLLSIIVPVYNTEQYLRNCLDSLVNQSFSDYELILIDDGSTDNSSVICDEYAEKDERITIVHKENGGVSSARNMGLNLAIGEYITVVDSDDWLEKNMYQTMLQKACEYDVDIIMCDCIKEYNGKSEIYSHNIREGLYTYSQLKEEYYPHLLMMETVEYPATISNWLMIWKRSLINNETIRYLPNVKNSEDLFFGSQIMSVAKSFYYMKGVNLYHYRMRENSASKAFSSDKWADYKKIVNEATRYFENNQLYNYKNQINIMTLFFLYNIIEDIRKSDLDLKEKMVLTNAILKDDIVRKMFDDIKIGSLKVGTKQKIKTFLYKHNLGLSFLLNS